MARKSQWQQFADNFGAMQGLVTDTAKSIEIGGLSKKDWLDEEGNRLEGSALDRAKNRALSDIYTKYGDAEGGLRVRASGAQLEGAEMSNEVMRSTLDDQIWQAGAGKSELMRAQINRANRGPSGRGRKPSTDELVSLAIGDALTRFEDDGGGESYTQREVRSQGDTWSDAPVTRQSPSSPQMGSQSGPRAAPQMAAPPAADSLPSVGAPAQEVSQLGGLRSAPNRVAAQRSAAPEAGVAQLRPPRGGLSGAREVQQVARADIPVSPSIEGYNMQDVGYTPREEDMRGVRTAGLGDEELVAAANRSEAPRDGAPSVMSEAPGQPMGGAPKKEQPLAVAIRGITAGEKPEKVFKKVQTQSQDRAGEFLLNVADNFVKSGRNDLASKVIELYKTHGEVRTAKILHKSETIKPLMQRALAEGGIPAAVQVLDEFNGPFRRVQQVTLPNGVNAVIEFEEGEGGEPINHRVVAQGDANQIAEQMYAAVQNPEERVAYLADVAKKDVEEAKARLGVNEADTADATFDDRVDQEKSKAAKDRADATTAQIDAIVKEAGMQGAIEKGAAGGSEKVMITNKWEANPMGVAEQVLMADLMGWDMDMVEELSQQYVDQRVEAASKAAMAEAETSTPAAETETQTPTSEASTGGLAGGERERDKLPVDVNHRKAATKLSTLAIREAVEALRTGDIDKLGRFGMTPDEVHPTRSPGFRAFITRALRNEPALSGLSDRGINELVDSLGLE